MADTLTEGQIAWCREVFNVYDKNNNGIIRSLELGMAMSALGHNPTVAELRDMIAVVDGGENGVVDFPEFLNLVAYESISREFDTEESLRDTFDACDTDQDGFISAAELRDVATSLGDEITDEEVSEMIRIADLDGDGMVSYEEFKRLMLEK